MALTLGLVALAAGAVPATAATDGDAESHFVALANGARADEGLPALTVRSDLRDVARRHARRMADEGRVFHNPGLPHEVDGWQRLGENVGKGPTVEPIHEAFMASASHRRNILDPGFTEVAVGVESRDGVLWVTQIFRQPAGSPAGGTQTPTATPDEPSPNSSPSHRDGTSEDPSGPASEGAAEPTDDGSWTAGRDGSLPTDRLVPGSDATLLPVVPPPSHTVLRPTASDPPADLSLSASTTSSPRHDVGTDGDTAWMRPCLRSVLPAGCVVRAPEGSIVDLDLVALLQPRATRF